MLALVDLLAAKRQAHAKRLEPQHFVSLLLQWDGWKQYDPVCSVELLAQWLGPFKQIQIQPTKVPTIFFGWQLLAVSQTLGLTREQVYTLILQHYQR